MTSPPRYEEVGLSDINHHHTTLSNTHPTNDEKDILPVPPPLDDQGHDANRPTEEERRTLRRIAGAIPTVCYILCAVEFAERASYYGVQPLFGNYIRNPMPVGGNGYGAPQKGSEDNAGALGKDSSISNAITQSFSMFVYALPVFWGWLADSKTGRWNLIVWGVWVCGVAHVLMIGSGAKTLLATGQAIVPFIISVYLLAIGAAMFKPNITPTLLDQMPVTVEVTKVLESGEKVIIDPDATTERVMLWFYLLINVGGFMNVPTAYIEKYVGWWLAFFIPLILYLPLPFLLHWVKKRLILFPPGGSELGKVFKILGICFKSGGLFKLIKGDFFAPAKPSNMAKAGRTIEVPWDDDFVEDVRRAFQACGIFSFFPIQFINDNGLGQAANIMSNMLKTQGAPNDIMSNFNSLMIILFNPVLNYGLYPLLRKSKIHYGPVARMTTGLFISTIGGMGYAILNHYAYKTGPCGSYGTSKSCKDAEGHSLVTDISIWWMAIPFALGGLSELFINVPAYGIAYSRSPKNLRGLVSAINLFATAIAYAIGLACSNIIKDPNLTWVFAAPTIIGAIATPVFYFMFRYIDKEEYKLTHHGDRHREFKEVHHTENNDIELSTVNRSK